MKRSLAIILLGIGLVPLAAHADTRGKQGGFDGNDVVLVSVSCDDLSAEARSRQAACMTPRANATAHAALTTVAPATRSATGAQNRSTRRIVRMPWQIGVFQ